MYAVTAATGQLGTLVVDRLLREMSADRIVAAVRDPAKAAAFRAKGVAVREADYDRPDTLRLAFAGVDRLLLVSGTEFGRRVAQHRAAIDAAREAGVGLIAYTSVLHADTSPLAVAPDHRDTETAIGASGIPAIILRNGWYTENRLLSLPAVLREAAVVGAAGDGRLSTATRADYADAAAAALTGAGEAGRIYELAGDESWTLRDLAAEIARQTGRQVTYRDLSRDGFRDALRQSGMPERFAEFLADADLFTRNDVLFDDGRQLSRLIGRPTTPLAVAVADALARQT